MTATTAQREAYLIVFVALAIFTLDVVHRQRGRVRRHTWISKIASLAIIIGVAVIKACLVGWVFMHLTFDWRKLYFMIIPAFILGVMMMMVLMPDIVLAWQHRRRPECPSVAICRRSPVVAALVLPACLASCPRHPARAHGRSLLRRRRFRPHRTRWPQGPRSDLHGKIWIASFVFTRCTGPCPQVSATMKQLPDRVRRRPRRAPRHIHRRSQDDTPEVLRSMPSVITPTPTAGCS